MAAEDFSVIILAGGQSRRMGRDKALLTWRGQALLAALAAEWRQVSDDIVVAGQPRAVLTEPAVRYAPDIIAGQGPLSGLHAGLLAVRHELAVVIACDMPFARPATGQQLAMACAGHEAVVAVHGERLEPLFACYRRSAAQPIAALLAAGKRRVVDLLAALAWRSYPLNGAAECRNLNTPTEYAAAAAEDILEKNNCKPLVQQDLAGSDAEEKKGYT